MRENDPRSGILGWRNRASIPVRWPGSLSWLVVELVFLAGSTAAFAQEGTLQDPSAEPVVTTELPENAPSLEQRGDLYMVRKYYAEAVRVYRRLCEAEPRLA